MLVGLGYVLVSTFVSTMSADDRLASELYTSSSAEENGNPAVRHFIGWVPANEVRDSIRNEQIRNTKTK